jgi:predicted Zn-dependent protease
VPSDMTDRIERLRRMLESDPGDAFCLYALGMEYSAAKEPSRAIAHLEASLRSEPDQPYAHYHIARCLVATGDRQGAAAAVTAGLEAATRANDVNATQELQALQEEL